MMYISDILRQSYNNLKSRKSTTALNIGLLFFSLIVIMASEMFSAFYNSGLGQIFNGVEGRTLQISYFDYAEDKDMTIDKLYDMVNSYFKNDKRVECVIIKHLANGVINANELDDALKKEDKTGVNLINYNSAYEAYLLEGKKGDLKKGEIYIPKYLNIDNEYLIDGESKIEYEDGDKYIGKKINIECSSMEYLTGEGIGSFQKEFTIAGTYDNFAQGDYEVTILCNFEDVKEMVQKQYVFDGDTGADKYEENMNEYMQSLGTSGYKFDEHEYIDEWKNYKKRTEGWIEVILNDYEDMDLVEEDILKQFNQYANRWHGEPDNKGIIDGIVNAVRITGYVLIAISAVNITCSMIKSIVKRRKEFALLSAVGYKNKNIYSMIFCEMVIITGISLAAVFVIYGIALLIVNIYVNYNLDEMYSRLSAVIPAGVWLTRLGLVFIGIIIAQLFSVHKVKSIVPAKELKEE